MPEKQKPGNESRALRKNEFPGDVLLSHAVYREVPSGLKGLTAVFGMGTGVAPSLRSPGKLVSLFVCKRVVLLLSIRALNILWSSRTAD